MLNLYNNYDNNDDDDDYNIKTVMFDERSSRNRRSTVQ
jgi:hypothetical protein